MLRVYVFGVACLMLVDLLLNLFLNLFYSFRICLCFRRRLFDAAWWLVFGMCFCSPHGWARVYVVVCLMLFLDLLLFVFVVLCFVVVCLMLSLILCFGYVLFVFDLFVFCCCV